MDLLYFGQLDERQKRLFAGLEASRLGWYGVKQVSVAYGIDVRTVRRGKGELGTLSSVGKVGIRAKSVSRKKKNFEGLGWLSAFESIVSHSTAGLPQDGEVKWTYLSKVQIQSSLLEKELTVSLYYIRQMLQQLGYKKRKMCKMKTLQEVANRNEQFEKIAAYRDSFTAAGLPILSIDTKNKEVLGDFGRSGTAYATGERKVLDHNFQGAEDVKMVPQGIYDVQRNVGYMALGVSKDTSAFVCDNLSHCWREYLQYEYPNADTVLVLCDGGGSNAAAHYIVKYDLVKLANDLNINILLAHYPPYCSKWNPIEHRLFSEISRTWDGAVLHNIDWVKKITDTTTTKKGLKVITHINEKTYHTKRMVPQEFKDNIQLYVTFDEQLPKWNYLITP